MTREADSELQKWGRMLFARAKPGARHPSRGVRIPTPDAIRREVRLALKRAPQVMVKVTGGGRGLAVIRAHMNYIDREDDGLSTKMGNGTKGAKPGARLRASGPGKAPPFPRGVIGARRSTSCGRCRPEPIPRSCWEPLRPWRRGNLQVTST